MDQVRYFIRHLKPSASKITSGKRIRKPGMLAVIYLAISFGKVNPPAIGCSSQFPLKGKVSVAYSNGKDRATAVHPAPTSPHHENKHYGINCIA